MKEKPIQPKSEQNLEKTDQWEGAELLDHISGLEDSLQGDSSSCCPSRPSERDIPKAIGRYPVKEWIGSGASGTVYLGIHPGLKREVAIKVIQIRLGVSRKSLEKRFFDEAAITDKLNHPNIIRVYDVGEDKMFGFYIVMEYAQGGDVGRLLKQKGTLDLGTSIPIIKGVAAALVEAEKLNLVHRDIKPQNIMLTSEGKVKLADLGLAKAIDIDNTMSLSHHPKGTPTYMAPEQVRDAKHVDIRADIYSLGATFYELVTGQRPFDGKSFYEILKTKSESGHFRKPIKLKPNLDPNINAIICKMMAQKPKDRYQSPSALLRELESYQTAPIQESKRPKLIIHLSMILIITLILIFSINGGRMAEKLVPRNSNWRNSAILFKVKAESQKQYLSGVEFPKHLSNDWNGIKKILKQGKSYLANEEYDKASTAFFEATGLMRALNVSHSNYISCLQTLQNLQETKTKIRSWFPELEPSLEWTKALEAESKAQSRFNEGLYQGGYELYRAALDSYTRIWEHGYRQQLDQYQMDLTQVTHEIKALKSSTSDPLIWQKAEELKKKLEHLNPKDTTPSTILKLWQDMLFQFRTAIDKELELVRTNASSREPQREAFSPDRQESETIDNTSRSKAKGKVHGLEIWETQVPSIPRIHSSPGSLNSEKFTPSTEGEDNVEVAKSISKYIPNRKIKISVYTDEGKQDYTENEVISFIVRADKDCYVAVLGHYVDGQTLLLFPNEYSSNNYLTANSSIRVPGENLQNFELYVHQPFGTDIIQVLACSDSKKLSEFLHNTLRDKSPVPNTPLASISQSKIKRGLQSIKRAIGYRPKIPLDSNDLGPVETIKWGEVRLPIYTSSN